MKKNFHLLALCMLSVYTSAWSQEQMKNWFIAPRKIYMPVGSAPQVTTISGTPFTANSLANGVYDNSGSGDLLFYIADGSIYDYNNVLLGSFTTGGAEIIIVPFGTNSSCQKKFNIFSTSSGGSQNVSLFQTIVDMNSYSVTNLPAIDNIALGGAVSTEFGSIAVGNLNASNERYMYFLAGPGTINSAFGMIKKLIIHNNGTVTATGQIYPTASNPNPNAGGEVFSQELDLSSDGKYLAWASFAPVNSPLGTQYRYHFLELNTITGDYVNNSYQKFNIPLIAGNNSSGFRGVEFFKSGTTTKLFIGAGTNGIYYTDIPGVSSFTQVQFSHGSPTSTYGLSQIELSFNGLMYASSGNPNNNIGAFDPKLIGPIMNNANAFNLISPLPPKVNWSNADFYTLPDQIDGQNYSLITPSPITQVVTTHTLNYPSNAATGQTTTWSYGAGNNPLGATTPIHVTKELRIRQNSNLTISGMTFKFSPNAEVVIEPGSTLTLDDFNGTPTVFTSNYTGDPCNVAYTWQGVEVWGGSSNESQNILPLKVGKLTIRDNSSIEYAICGARAQKTNDNNFRGGIIVATSGAAFKNCIMDVEFLPYQNSLNNSKFN